MGATMRTKQIRVLALLLAVLGGSGATSAQGVLTLANPGTWTNTSDTWSSIVNVNSCTPRSFPGTSLYSTNGQASCIVVPSTSGVTNADPFWGQCYNFSTATACVPFLGSSFAQANNTQNWGSNFTCNDNGFGVHCTVSELDIGISNTTTTGQFILLQGAFTAQPSVFFAAMQIGPFSGSGHATVGINFASGCCGPDALNFGAQTTGAAPSSSQQIVFNATNSMGHTITAIDVLDSFGNRTFAVPGGLLLDRKSVV